MCGVVDGGIVPGAWGYEAGQSGVGDIFAWFVEQRRAARLPRARAAARRRASTSTSRRSAGAAAVGEHGLVALDWWSGNRSVLVDHELTGALVGMTLATRAARDLPRADRGDGVRRRARSSTPSTAAGVPVREFIAAGGLLRNAAADALLRRCPRDADQRDRRPSRGRRSARRCTPPSRPACTTTSSRRRAAMGRVRRDVYVPDASRARVPTMSCMRSTRGCTTTSDARERELMRELQAMRERARVDERGRRHAGPGRRPARRARAHRPGRLDEGNLSARVPGEDADRDQAERRRLRRAHAGVDGRSSTCDGERASRASSRPRATPRRTRTSTGRCRDVGGVVHTHSPYATAWAARGRADPLRR